MKRVLSSLLAGFMLLSSGVVYAGLVEPVPVLISSDVSQDNALEQAFEVIVNGDDFKIVIDENPSTGYEWSYKINDLSQVKFIDSTYKASVTEGVGAGGQKIFEFSALKEGVSTITLTLKRSWKTEVAETIQVLVYNKEGKLIVEEDGLASIQDGGLVECYESGTIRSLTDSKLSVKNDKKLVEISLSPKRVDGAVMLPLRDVLESLGYKVTWNGELQSIEISKGTQWTSIKLDNNSYFKNKMAPQKLSAAPSLIDGSTYVPMEFFVEMLGLGLQVKEGNITFNNGMVAIHQGFVKDVQWDETGTMTITLTKNMESEDLSDLTIIHTSHNYTYFSKDAVVGQSIKVISSAMMTMSIPGQTSAYLVY